jgi:hypothetical protein
LTELIIEILTAKGSVIKNKWKLLLHDSGNPDKLVIVWNFDCKEGEREIILKELYAIESQNNENPDDDLNYHESHLFYK